MKYAYKETVAIQNNDFDVTEVTFYLSEEEKKKVDNAFQKARSKDFYSITVEIEKADFWTDGGLEAEFKPGGIYITIFKDNMILEAKSSFDFSHGFQSDDLLGLKNLSHYYYLNENKEKVFLTRFDLRNCYFASGFDGHANPGDMYFSHLTSNGTTLNPVYNIMGYVERYPQYAGKDVRETNFWENGTFYSVHYWENGEYSHSKKLTEDIAKSEGRLLLIGCISYFELDNAKVMKVAV